MPTLPTVELRSQAPRPRYPEVQPGPGAFAARGLKDLSEGFDYQARLNDASDKAEAARIVSESRALFSAAISEESLSKADFNEFREAATTRLTELHAKALETQNPRVRSLVQGALQDDLIRSQTLIKQETFKKQKDKVGADYLVTMDQLAKSSVGVDEATQRRNAAEFSVLQASLVDDGFMTREQAIKDQKAFRDDVAVHTAQSMIDDGRADQVLRDNSAGKFDSIDPEKRRRVINDARTQLERDERNADKAKDEVKKLVMNGWQAAANRNELQTKYGAELQEALDGKNPYINAKEARELLNADNNAPSGAGGKLAVAGIMAGYYLKPRSLAAIEATRKELRALQSSLGRASPEINKAANELQSDQTTIENQNISREANEIARQNREVRDITTVYDANKQEIPQALQRIFGNHDVQNRAKIKLEYDRKGPEAAKKLAEELSKGIKQKADAIPQKNKAVIDQVQ